MLSLTLEEGVKKGEGSEGTSASRNLGREDLLGLRARLAIMEVPPEEEGRWEASWGHGARVVVNVFKIQLQVMRAKEIVRCHDVFSVGRDSHSMVVIRRGES